MMVQAIESLSIRLSLKVIGRERKKFSRRIEETSGTIKQVLSKEALLLKLMGPAFWLNGKTGRLAKIAATSSTSSRHCCRIIGKF